MFTRRSRHSSFLHATDAVRKGCSKLCLRTVDTDVVVLVIAMFNHLNADGLWLAFGTKSHFRYIPIHEIVAGLDPRICTTLPVFHALTGCDTVSAFGGRGKRTAWNTWKVFPDLQQLLHIFYSWKITLVSQLDQCRDDL